MFVVVLFLFVFVVLFLFCCYLFVFVVGGGDGGGGGGGGFGHTDSFNTKNVPISSCYGVCLWIFYTAYCSISSPNGMHVNYYDFLS